MPAPSRSVLESPARLAALDRYQILDTPPEAEFDDIVLVAKQVCDTPVALVSLVTGERQWFKAKIGLDACETPVDPSVCGHAVAQGSTLVIGDLTQDERTRDSVLVTEEPSLRFYAGALLQTQDGQILGTLCVIDVVARPQGLTAGQTQALEALARQVMILLEARRALTFSDADLAAERRLGAALREADARTQASHRAGGVGTFEVDIETDMLTCSAIMCRLYGVPVAEHYPSEVFEALTLDRDVPAASTPENRIDGSAPLDVEYRIRRASDGAVRWIARRGRFNTDPDGKPITFAGAVQDITERKVAGLRQMALLGLGDKLRDASTIADTVEAAARTAGDSLDVARAGLLMIDATGGTVLLEREWTAAGVEPRGGYFSTQLFKETLARLTRGETLAVANIPAAAWLGEDARAYALVGAAAQIVAPISRQGRLAGLLYVHNATPRTWSREEIEFVHGIADRTDATIARIQAEQERILLNQELSHRLKNTLAMVQGYARQTLKDVSDKAAVEAFNQRVFALSHAHDVLLQENWAAARMRPVMDGVLGIHADPAQLQLDGPDLSLGPKAALSLSMLLHELATNAAKHGALSRTAGRVTVDWRVEHGGGAATLVLAWRETGGPPPQVGGKSGFGSRLIRMGLSSAGSADVRYDPEGVFAEFRAPLDLLTEN